TAGPRDVAGRDVHLIAQLDEFTGRLPDELNVGLVTPVVLRREAEDAERAVGICGSLEIGCMIAAGAKLTGQCMSQVKSLVSELGNACSHDGPAVPADHAVRGNTCGFSGASRQIEDG